MMNYLTQTVLEDGKPSLGRLLLVTTFVVMVAFWIVFLGMTILGMKGADAPTSLTAAFAAELMYVLGGKGVSQYFSNGNSSTKISGPE